MPGLHFHGFTGIYIENSRSWRSRAQDPGVRWIEGSETRSGHCFTHPVVSGETVASQEATEYVLIYSRLFTEWGRVVCSLSPMVIPDWKVGPWIWKWMRGRSHSLVAYSCRGLGFKWKSAARLRSTMWRRQSSQVNKMWGRIETCILEVGNWSSPEAL